jgi:hypothetical protein
MVSLWCLQLYYEGILYDFASNGQYRFAASNGKDPYGNGSRQGKDKTTGSEHFP